VWRETVIFLNYDECDGYFDHVPPAVRSAGHGGRVPQSPAAGPARDDGTDAPHSGTRHPAAARTSGFVRPAHAGRRAKRVRHKSGYRARLRK